MMLPVVSSRPTKHPQALRSGRVLDISLFKVLSEQLQTELGSGLTYDLCKRSLCEMVVSFSTGRFSCILGSDKGPQSCIVQSSSPMVGPQDCLKACKR